MTATETVLLIKNIPNHDDDGALNNTLGVRQATGMIVVGTAPELRKIEEMFAPGEAVAG